VQVDVWWGECEPRAPGCYDLGSTIAAVEAAARLGLRARVALHFHAGYSWTEEEVEVDEEEEQQQQQEAARLGGADAQQQQQPRPRSSALRRRRVRRYHPLPAWVRAVGAANPDIYYRDAQGSTSERECLTLGVDDVPALAGRTATECYAGLARALAVELAARGLWGGSGQGSASGGVADVVVGLGPGGELRYPSHPDDGAADPLLGPPDRRWSYPCVGEFQCYDRYMLSSLRAAAEERGAPHWGLSGPHDAVGGYKAASPDTLGFFASQGGSWDSEYGAFFLEWYARSLVGHACRVLDAVSAAVGEAAATMVGGGGSGAAGRPPSPLSSPPPRLHARLPAVHWWHSSPQRAAELTAGYHGDEPYLQALLALARRGVGAELAVVAPLSCCSPEHQAHWHHHSSVLAASADDPRGLLRQQRGTAAAVGVPVLTLVARPRGLGGAALGGGLSPDEAAAALAELAAAATATVAGSGEEDAAEYRGIELVMPDAVSVDGAFADYWLAGGVEEQQQVLVEEEQRLLRVAAAESRAPAPSAAAPAPSATADDDAFAAFFLADEPEHDHGVTHQARNAYGVPAELIAQHRALLEQRRRQEREQELQQPQQPQQVPARV
jgi:hypothetical protein